MTLQYKQSKTVAKYVSNHVVLGLLLLLLAAGFLLPRDAKAAITYVQGANNSSIPPVTTLSEAFSSNNTAGNFIIVWVGWHSSTTTAAVSDSANNVYQPLSAAIFPNIPLKGQIFYARNVFGGANTVSVTISASTPYVVLDIHEYAGIDPVSPVDADARLDNTTCGLSCGTTPIAGSVTTTHALDLLFGAASTNRDAANEASWTPETGYTLRQSNQWTGTEDQIATSTGGYSATFTVPTADHWVGEIAAFKPAVGGVQVSSRSDVLSNSQPSSTSNHAFTFTINSAVSGSSTLVLALPGRFSFTPANFRLKAELGERRGVSPTWLLQDTSGLRLDARLLCPPHDFANQLRVGKPPLKQKTS